jgi:hypothetical protein
MADTKERGFKKEEKKKAAREPPYGYRLTQGPPRKLDAAKGL